MPPGGLSSNAAGAAACTAARFVVQAGVAVHAAAPALRWSSDRQAPWRTTAVQLRSLVLENFGLPERVSVFHPLWLLLLRVVSPGQHSFSRRAPE